VLTIAHHRLIDARRRAGRRPELPEGGSIETAVPRGDVEREALERLGTERVHGLLAILTVEQRAVLLLRIVGDLTVEQVARALGKRAGAIKQLQRRVLLALRRELEREGVTR
jgi:RNA polymerase sigma-70 factor (ECF subfamily)